MSPDPNKPPFWVPNVDVLVNAAGELIIKAELAGMSREEIEIAIEGQRLTVSGQRPDPDGKHSTALVTEMHHGRFESVLEAPNIFDLSQAHIAHENGMLGILAPRRPDRTGTVKP